MLVASGEADDARDLLALAELAHGARDVPHAPAAARDDHHPSVLGQAERAPARVESGSAARGTRPRSADARSCTLPRPAIRSTDGIDSPYITRCMSIPGCAQKKRPVRSVIVATVGQSISPRCAAAARARPSPPGRWTRSHRGRARRSHRASGREPEQAQQPARERANRQRRARAASTRACSVHGMRRSCTR